MVNEIHIYTGTLLGREIYMIKKNHTESSIHVYRVFLSVSKIKNNSLVIKDHYYTLVSVILK